MNIRCRHVCRPLTVWPLCEVSTKDNAFFQTTTVYCLLFALRSVRRSYFFPSPLCQCFKFRENSQKFGWLVVGGYPTIRYVPAAPACTSTVFNRSVVRQIARTKMGVTAEYAEREIRRTRKTNESINQSSYQQTTTPSSKERGKAAFLPFVSESIIIVIQNNSLLPLFNLQWQRGPLTPVITTEMAGPYWLVQHLFDKKSEHRSYRILWMMMRNYSS